MLRIEILQGNAWQPSAVVIRQEVEQHPILYAEIPVAFEWSISDSVVTTQDVIIAFEATLRITDQGFDLERNKAIETVTGMAPTNEYYIAEVLWDKEEQIAATLEQTRGDLPITLPQEIRSNSQLGWIATAPVDGIDLIRWILRTALICGLTMPITALAAYGLKPDGTLL